MNTVIVMIETILHEGIEIHGVFSSYEKFRQAVKQMPPGSKGHERIYDYMEFEIDKLPEEAKGETK